MKYDDIVGRTVKEISNKMFQYYENTLFLNKISHHFISIN